MRESLPVCPHPTASLRKRGSRPAPLSGGGMPDGSTSALSLIQCSAGPAEGAAPGRRLKIPRENVRGMERRVALSFPVTPRPARWCDDRLRDHRWRTRPPEAWRPWRKDARPSALHRGICVRALARSCHRLQGRVSWDEHWRSPSPASSSQTDRSVGRAGPGAAREPCVRGTARGKPLQTEASRLRPSAGAGGLKFAAPRPHLRPQPNHRSAPPQDASRCAPR